MCKDRKTGLRSGFTAVNLDGTVSLYGPRTVTPYKKSSTAVNHFTSDSVYVLVESIIYIIHF